ncbi:MAG TPA: hypothetical protein VMV49_17085 [Candidatus Deferrimicrobium sp.]|nr:hypothetical protein [Candidatus Deferrimicrobium sp.]
MSFYESDLGKEYLKYCQLKKITLNTSILNLSDIKWFFPTCLLPLGIFIKEHQEISVIPPKVPEISNYLELIIKNTLHHAKKSYIPIIEIPPNAKLREKILEPFMSNQKAHVGGQNAFAYFIGELIDNIYEHSNFSTAYIMAQKYQKMNFTEIGIIDNGISIPGSYENKGFKFTDINALEEALKGLSTKSDERGYGLRTSLRLLTEGLEANCLIVSRGAGLIKDKNETIFYEMEKFNTFNGTLISIRIPYKIKEVNIYDYIE